MQSRKSTSGRFRRRLKQILVAVVGLPLLIVIVVSAMILFTGWRALFPAQMTTEERLKQFPPGTMSLNDQVHIYWDDYQIPFIEAQTDHDAAFVLGVVHGHLRAGQMALLKRASQGRLAEMFGPIAANIDVAIQTLDLGYAADAIIDSLSPHTRQWLEAFVDGVNFQQNHTRSKPPEFGLLGIEPELYTLRDIVTLGRLAGADVNWFAFFALLPARSRDGWPELWRRAVETGTNGTPTFENHRQLDELRKMLIGLSRSGSNSVAVSGEKSATGAAMLANDPHLGIFIPNFWLLVGIKSQSYHCVGMMIPGLPFVALGRNPYLAWGGTNMRAASSDLYDVSDLPDDEITRQQKHVKVRWWRDRSFTARRTPLGPILTDASIVPSADTDTLALRWVGHQGTNDIGAFLKANRATSIVEFIEAFRGYAVSGQNMLVTDTAGNIAMALAVRLPQRRYEKPPALVLDPDNVDHQWQGYLEAPDLPVAFNPPEGYIASANNKPTDHNPPIGFFFSESERIDRLHELLTARDKVDLAFLKQLQTDVYSRFAHRLAARWLQVVDQLELTQRAPALVEELRSWDGHYRAESRGPVAFELLTNYISAGMSETPRSFVRRSWTYVANYLADDLAALPEDQRKQIVDSALAKAQIDFKRFQSWGEMHRIQAAWTLARLPLIGSRFVYADYPASGSRETILKTNHGLSADRSYTTYGSQSRHISVMDDPDHNYFVLFGGNDGWLGSDNLIDQVPLWRQAEYIRLPLRLESVRSRCRYHMTLSPDTDMVLQSQDTQ